MWGKREKNIFIGLVTSYKITAIPNIPIPKYNLNNVCPVFKLDLMVWKKNDIEKIPILKRICDIANIIISKYLNNTIKLQIIVLIVVNDVNDIYVI